MRSGYAEATLQIREGLQRALEAEFARQALDVQIRQAFENLHRLLDAELAHQPCKGNIRRALAPFSPMSMTSS